MVERHRLHAFQQVVVAVIVAHVFMPSLSRRCAHRLLAACLRVLLVACVLMRGAAVAGFALGHALAAIAVCREAGTLR